MTTRTKWVIYGIIPFSVSILLQGMYFSGNLVLQRLVCPKLPPLNLGAYREFGLLENLQNLLVLGVLVAFAAGALRAARTRLRLLFGMLALFSTFVLLEEIDYGTHWYAYLTADEVSGWFVPATSPEFQALLRQTDMTEEPFNIHNRGAMTDIIKAIASAVMAALFVIAPLVRNRIRNPWLEYIVPDPFILVTLFIMLGLRGVTHLLGEMDQQLVAAARASGGATRELGAMTNNLSEFRELLIYYIFLLYAGTIVFFRTPPE